MDKQSTTPSASPGSMRWVLFYAVLVVVLLWPMAIRSTPFFFSDALSYVKGGAVIYDFVAVQLGVEEEEAVETGADEDAADWEDPAYVVADEVSEGIVGMRSPTYSALAYAAYRIHTGMAGLAVVQALICGLVILAFVRAGLPNTGGWILSIPLILLALGTGAPWYVSYLTPDIFAATTIFGIAILAFYGQRLSVLSTLVLIAIVTFSLTTHTRNLMICAPIYLWLLLVWCWESWRGKANVSWLRRLSAVAPIIISIVGISLVSYIGFGEISLAPKRYPYVLARSVADGPGMWHLEEHGEEYGYTVYYVFPGDFPDQVGLFLWGSEGLEQTATPEEMDKIREEEFLIVARAFAEYPVEQLQAIIGNMATQLAQFGIIGLETEHRLAADEEGNPVRVETIPVSERLLISAERVQYGVAILSIGAYILLRAFGKLTLEERRTASLLIVAFIANAFIAGAMSSPAHRYQGSIMWLLPLCTTIWIIRQMLSPSRGDSIQE